MMAPLFLLTERHFYDIKLPCPFRGQELLVIDNRRGKTMEHAQIRGLLGQQVSELVARPGNLPVTLRPYQTETLEATAKWLLNLEGTRRAYVAHATGLGKTVLFSSIEAAAIGLRSLVVVPTKVLLEQTARTIARFTGGVLGHLSSLADIENNDGDLVAVRGLDHSSIVLTTDASFNKFAALIKQQFDPELILRDECHWGYEPDSLAALEQFPEAVIIGFSATPDYLTNTAKGGYRPVTLENGRTLYGPVERFADTHFQTCLDRRSVRWGIENGYLAPLAWGRIEFDVNMKDIRVVNGPNGPDYDEGQLQQLMANHWSVMCETVRRLYDNPDYDLAKRQAYAVCPSVDSAEELARAIGSLGIPTACITGRTSDKERNILLDAYRNDEIRFLSSVMVLREGWDAPNAEVCMMLRITKSRVLYEQAMGRGLRLLERNPNKVALILDAHFQGRTFAPLSAPYLYGGPETEIAQGGLIIRGGGARGGQVLESPYLPKEAEPKLVIIQDEDASEDLSDKRNWLSIGGLASLLKRSHAAVEERLTRGAADGLVTRRIVLSVGGRERFLYKVDEALALCKDLSIEIIDARKIVQLDGEDWGAEKALVGALGTTHKIIRSNLPHPSVRSQQKRGRNKKPISVYNVSDVKKLLATYLLEKADEEGFLVVKGKKCATPAKLASVLGPRIDQRKLTLILKQRGVKTHKGRTKLGRPRIFYDLEEAREMLQDLICAKPKVDLQGLTIHKAEIWGLPDGIASHLELTTAKVRAFIAQNPGLVRSLPGLDLSNRDITLYSMADVKAHYPK